MVTISEIQTQFDELTSACDSDDSALDKQLLLLISGVGEVAIGVSQLQSADSACVEVTKCKLAQALDTLLGEAKALADQAEVQLRRTLRPNLSIAPIKWDRG
jgi:hypothetical protein